MANFRKVKIGDICEKVDRPREKMEKYLTPSELKNLKEGWVL